MFEVYPGYNETPMTELAMQQPMFSYGAPYAIDWNNDNVLDLWHHNHFAFSEFDSRWSDPSTEVKGPIDKGPGGCMVDWDAVLQNPNDGTFYAANNGDGFIHWSDKNTDSFCFDVHSTSYVDINNDGIKDLFLITGGGRGLATSYEADHLLFQGEPDSSNLGFRLVGGRDAALSVGVEGRDTRGSGRGRHHYWIDMDNDGLLDLVFLNNERTDDSVIPGNIYRNNGDRFVRVKPGRRGFDEFAIMAVLTDLTGDEHARHFVVPSHCSGMKNYVCKRSPRGTTTVYQRDSSKRFLTRVSSTPPFRSDEKTANSIVTADFDMDVLADVAILWKTRIDFFLSSRRQRRCNKLSNTYKRRKCLLTMGTPDEELQVTKCGKNGAKILRAMDANLDGHIDLLVLCRDPGKHILFERIQGRWEEMRMPNSMETVDLGDLNSRDLMLGGSDFCDGIPISNQVSLSKRPRCDRIFSADECKNVRYKNQFVICSLRAKSAKFSPYVIGATIADIDNDGFSDVIVTYFLGSTVMFRNLFGQLGAKRYLAVRLDRTAGEAASIGAIVKLTTKRMGRFQNETLTQMRLMSSLSHETDANGGHDDRLIFGLGERGRVVKLVVQWPHCCEKTVVSSQEGKFWKWYNSMIRPFEVPPPTNCETSCFKG